MDIQAISFLFPGSVAKLSELTSPLHSRSFGYTPKQRHSAATASLQSPPTIKPLIRSHPIIQHRLHNQTMPIPSLAAPLGLKIQPVRPKVAAATTNLRTRTIPAAQQRQSLRPIPTSTQIIKRFPLANSQSVRDLVKGGALGLVSRVGAETQVAVVVCFRRGDAGGVVDADGFGDGGGEALVPGYSRGHGGVDARVSGGLVCCWVGSAFEGPGYCCGGEGEEG